MPKVEIELEDLVTLCAAIDYRPNEIGRGCAEELSVELADQFGFDTHDFLIRKGWRWGLEDEPETRVRKR